MPDPGAPETSGAPIRDARGRVWSQKGPPRRIVSLVPSWTELLFEFGCADRVTGVTEYCVHPPEARIRAVVVGGTKTPSVERIRDLAPDLVIANQEENRKLDVERMERSGLPVFVTYARTVSDAVGEITSLGAMLSCGDAARALALEIEAELLRCDSRGPPVAVVALVWKSPYMAVGGDCFAHDLLVRCGARNGFAGERRRYPAVSVEDLCTARPDVILLPTEPYAFTSVDRDELLALPCPASQSGRVHIIEGELLTWYGPRIPRALREIRELLRPT